MVNTLLIAGIVCIVAAVVGGGVKLFGNELPVLGSTRRQVLLAVVGLAFLIASYFVAHPAALSPTSAAKTDATAQAPVCGLSNGLECLPKSSGPVVFRYPAAANEAAAHNLADHLTTTDAQFEAQQAGATGKASRLCAIVASYDSSALGKHLAAVALAAGTADGRATQACLKVAQNFL